MYQAAEAVGREALNFLVRQRLAPTPQNYTLAYLAVTQPTSLLARAVQAITDGGIRMKQAEADELISLYAVSHAQGEADQDDAERSALRHQTIRLGEMAASAAVASGEFTRDLSEDARSLDEAGTTTLQIVSRMIERSQRAEDELRSAAREAEELREQLETARGDAERDDLTGLGNRRAIDRRLAEYVERGQSCTVGLCDVDHFKGINDRYGHAVGDRVLKAIAATLADTCAPHFVGRWGGEEFCVLIPGDDLRHGVKLLDDARKALLAREIKLRETDEPLGKLSFSAGVAVHDRLAADIKAAVRQADRGLYSAKAAGRNTVIALVDG